MLIKQVTNLSTVLAFKDSNKCLLRVFLLVFVNGPTFLQLFQCYLKLLLRLNQVLLVGLLLLFHEVALAFPECLFSVVVALHIEKLLF